MMKVLTDAKSKGEALREAAGNLARLGEERTLGTTVWTGGVRAERKAPNPAVAKFSKPTVAEAILAAMDRDLAAHDAKKRDGLYDYDRRQIEDSFLEPLIDLADKRKAPELAKRSRMASSGRMRRKWAFACQRLGDAEPFRRFIKDFGAGRVKLPANDELQSNEDEQPGNEELRGIIGHLVSMGTAEADGALIALATPTHRYHGMAAKLILRDDRFMPDRSPWFSHPFCLAFLRRALDDTELTGAIYTIEGGYLKREQEGYRNESIPELLADASARKAQAAERACDGAAAKLLTLAAGLPAYHPLLKDAETRLRAIKETLDRFRGRYRLASPREEAALGVDTWEVAFIPDLRPLGRAATPEDVKAGRAIFWTCSRSLLE
jgi:hypothetical protein